MRCKRPLVLCLALAASFLSAADDPGQQGPDAGASFWLAPKADIDLGGLAPVPVTLLSAPDDARRFALIKIAAFDPSDNYVPSRPDLVPLIAEKDTRYRIEPGGLKAGVRAYGDRKYALKDVPDPLKGLTLLQTKMGHKAIVDGRFSVVVSVDRPSYAFVAVDSRALETYKAVGAPTWLQEYAPTGLKVTTDEPIMNEVGASYLVFVKKVPAAGRVAFGSPALDENLNAMYFAFFAAAK